MFPGRFRKSVANLGARCFERVTEWPGVALLPPALHHLQAELPSKDSGIGRVIAQSPR